jgi:hypothetical protein
MAQKIPDPMIPEHFSNTKLSGDISKNLINNVSSIYIIPIKFILNLNF